MRILALQLKRIGDLILTTPALAALRAEWPEAHLALAVSEGCAPLLPAIPHIDTTLVFGRKRGFAPWQQAISGTWSLCLDFTGNDRSALAAALSRAKQRATFAWVQRNKMRALAYSRFVDSPVRDRHTVDHYLDLARVVVPAGNSLPMNEANATPASPELHLPANAQTAADALLADAGVAPAFALLHPGTARPEKYWLPDRWATLAEALHRTHGLPCALTCGPDAFERAHAAEIQSRLPHLALRLLHPPDLLTLAALAARARIVVSCDTAMVHLAAAFRTPQVALFGPTNPFNWRPRHERAIVLSAAQPEAPLTDFRPRMKGAPMEKLPLSLVLESCAHLLRGSAEKASESHE